MQFILYIRVKGRDVREGYMKSIGGRIRGQEKAKPGNLWDWIKSKTERHMLLLHWWVQDG